MSNALRFFFFGFALISMVGVGMTACSDKTAPPAAAAAPVVSGPATTPSTQVLGVAPAGSTADPAAGTSPAKSDMSRVEQSSAMPMPGQANDHSVLGPKPVDKSSGK